VECVREKWLMRESLSVDSNESEERVGYGGNESRRMMRIDRS
jgi:hypothetical protein